MRADERAEVENLAAELMGFSAGSLIRPRLHGNGLALSNRSDVGKNALIIGVSRRIHQGALTDATMRRSRS